MLGSRTLEEMLPFICERCGFSFMRNLDELFKIGIHCPNCLLAIQLNEDEVAEVAGMIQACHEAEDASIELEDEPEDDTQ